MRANWKETVVAAGTAEMSPVTCIGGKFCRIGRSGSVTADSSEVTVGAGVEATAGSNLPTPSRTVGVDSGFGAGIGDNLKGILVGGAGGDGGGGAEGGTGGPLEAGTRGSAGSPVPFGKDPSGTCSTTTRFSGVTGFSENGIRDSADFSAVVRKLIEWRERRMYD